MFERLFHRNHHQKARRNSEPATNVLSVRFQGVTIGSRQQPQQQHQGDPRMLDTTPYNVIYGNSMDHGYESGTSNENSRRSSFGIRELQLPTSSSNRRRYTMQSRNQLQKPTDPNRKTSYTYHQTPENMETDEDVGAVGMSRRRMSVPENVFRQCDFAILRPIRAFTDRNYEVLSGFDKNTDAYQTYMKAFTCYDVQPTHAALIVFDSRTKVKSAVNGLCAQGHCYGVIMDTEKQISEGVFTMNDCLTAIMMVATGDKEVAGKTVIEFVKQYGSSALICSDVEKSIWEAGKVLSLNRLHAIPIFDTVEPKPATPLFFLTAKLILHQSVLRLTDHCDGNLLPVRMATIDQKKLGTWSDFVTINHNTPIKDAVKIFVERKFSTLPVLNDFDQLVGLISRKDLVNEVMCQQTTCVVLDQPVKSLPTMKNRPIFGHCDMTIFETIRKMENTDKQCLPIVNTKLQIQAIVSYSDILNYFQTCHSSGNRTPTDERSSTDSSSSK
ncbi:unnamed protein product [Caenorhabditis angaria]|uniref:CBS domain-containing protein n=1 Tax=Caenorhabditis angaria TaxID=860376 RepID=A0A9P1N8V9_9PELO|nr:unnamed protein product [Caenorhabditis angaria]